MVEKTQMGARMTVCVAAVLLFILVQAKPQPRQIAVEIESPRSGLSTDDSDPHALQIHVKIRGQDLSQAGMDLAVFVNGKKWSETSKNQVQLLAPHAWQPAVHTVQAVVRDSDGNSVSTAESNFLVFDSSAMTLRDHTCHNFSLAQVADHEARVGFHVLKWSAMRRCMSAFAQTYDSSAAVFQLALLDEAEGNWEGAADRYAASIAMGYPHSAGAQWLKGKVEEMRSISAEQGRKPNCTWQSFAQCSATDPQSCRARESVHDVGIAKVLDEEEDADLYLSIVMVTRHDNTQFCQSPPDACLNRFRASMSILLDLLAKHKLASDTELLLVEWNPCYVNSKQEEGACDPRADGYMSVEQMVRELVVAQGASGVQVRVLFVSEAEHDKLYNPYDFDLMEFIGKNVAARRARGKFLLFGNPDDCWSDQLVARLAMRELRTDVLYSTFRGVVLDDVPVAPGASATSLRRFVERNRESTEHQPLSVAHVAGHWRRAACLPGERDQDPMRSDRYGYFHDSAAGDFLLLPRAVVRAIRGYPEIPTNIMIDGTAIHAAAAHGYGQLVFAGECVIYHQPHPRSYNTKGSMISLPAYESLAQQLLLAKTDANHRPASVLVRENQREEDAVPWHRWNTERWGLADADIPQIILAPVCAEP